MEVDMCLQEWNIFINFNLFFASRPVCRKTDGLRVRVNPILVFIQWPGLPPMWTIAHCKSISRFSMSPRTTAQKPILGSFRRGTRPLNEEIFPRPRWYYGIRQNNIIRAAASYLAIEIVEQILPRTMNSDEFEFSTFDVF